MSRRIRSIALLRPVLISQAQGFAGTPARRPLFQRGGEGLLAGLLGQIEIAEQADQGCENTTRLSAKYFLMHGAAAAHCRRRSGGQTGRTSMLPTLAPGMRAAMAIASSRFFASTR